MLAVNAHVLLACEVIGHHDLQYLLPGVGNKLRGLVVYPLHKGQVKIQDLVLVAGNDGLQLVLVVGVLQFFHC